MKSKIRYGDSVIQYTVIKSKRRKTSEIRVDEKGVEIRTPFYKKDSDVQKIIHDQKHWIYKKQLLFKDRKKQRKRLYKTKLKDTYLEKRAQKLSSKIGIKPSKIVIKSLKNRWGSATEKGVVTLNSNLLKAPKEVIDYIIIHELCHLRIKGHSFRYWNLVRKFMANYEDKKQWLEANGKTIL